ncbi:tRNA-dihydrouridine synthase [Candidatus Latescibacterota bacterium]
MKRREFIHTAISSTALSGCSLGRYNHSNDISPKVFEPITIRNLTIPNRTVFPPITMNYADDEGFVTQRLINFHNNVATGGAGLSIVGATAVRKDGKIVSGTQMLDDDKYIEGFWKLFEAIKQSGSIACIQLLHSGRQISSSVIGSQPVAPSPIPYPGSKETPRELSVQEIKELVDCFADAAYRSKMAGADMIELHCAHGYLISGFFSPFSNKRTDQYGGSIENRTRFVREILRETRNKVGDNYPICCRFSADEFVDGGLTISESKEIAQILEDSSVDVISVSAGVYGSKYSIIPNKEQGRRCYTYLAKEIKKNVNVPVIGVGNILDIKDAEKVLIDGDADMAAIGRALIADPYLIAKTKEGKTSEISGCIQCGNCTRTIRQGVSCSVNKNL